MSLKENIKKSFSNEKELALLRYNSVKTILVFSSLLFFSNFFILWAGIKYDYFIKFLPFTYFYLLLSLLFYFYFLIKVKLNFSKLFLVFIFIFLLIIIFLLFLPFIFENWISDLINIIK